MKIEIWSDIMCPFCYIGKKNFDLALSKFEKAGKFEVIYKSFQLDPDYYNVNGDTIYSYLSDFKKMPFDQVEGMIAHVTNLGREAGININFSITLPGNTFDAHRLIHLAQQEDKALQTIDALFVAHFEEGKDVSDKQLLSEIGERAGINKEKIKELWETDKLSYEVNQDIMESRNLGINSVPFFVFDRKYAISGAQPVTSFTEVLQKSFANWRKENPLFVELNSNQEGGSCSENGC